MTPRSGFAIGMFGVGLLFVACGGSASSVPTGEGDGNKTQAGGYSFTSCSNGRITTEWCASNCDPPEGFCDLGGGACRIGACVDAGADAANVPASCGDKTCTGDEACVVTSSGGGACQVPEDGGLCPDGLPANPCCNRTTTTYECKPLPAACGGHAASCACAASLCTCGGCGVDTNTGALTCGCFYP